MKKLFALLAVVLAVVSCQKDADLDVNVGGEQLVNITVALPEETRAASGTGFDLTTLEANGLELRYILEIYVEDTNAVNDQQRIRKEAYTTATSDVVFPVRLVAGQNRNYRIVAWADIVPADANRTEDGDYDYYYETSEGLDQILINEAKWTAMKEQRDAYTAFKVVNNFSANSVINLTLKRPFAKVRVVSTDIKNFEDLGYKLSEGSVNYTVELNRQYNALYGTASNAAAKTHTFAYPTPYSKSGDAYETETQRTLFADYIFVDNIEEQDAIRFNLDIKDQFGANLNTIPFNTDIALYANTLTTIIGEVLTEGGKVEVDVNGDFEKENSVFYAFSNGGTVTLDKNYELGSTLYVKSGVKATLNLNGKTLKSVYDANNYSDVIVVEEGAELTINGDGTIEAVGGKSNFTVIVDGKLTINGGTFKSGVDEVNDPNAVIYVRGKGEAYVNGGNFPNELNSKYILNKKDADRATTKIEVRGGRFQNFDPGNNAAENAGTNFLAAGYVSVANGEWFDVVKGATVASVEDLQKVIENAQAGDTITIASDITLIEAVTIPAGVIFNGNGKQINGSLVAGGDVTFIGHTKVTSFSASYYNRTITIEKDACLEITGTDRVSLAYGNTFDIKGNIENAKSADKANIQPSLIIPGGISITGGNDAVFNIKNTYVKIGSTSSKNNAANGTFTINIENSIAEFTNQLTFAVPTSGKNPTFNLNVKNSVLTTGTKLILAAPNCNMVVDNSTIETTTYFRNSGKVELKNGSVLKGSTIQFGENGGHDGETVVNNSEFTIIGGSTVNAFDGKGIGSIKAQNGATVAVDYYKDMTIEVDATSTFTGTKVF